MALSGGLKRILRRFGEPIPARFLLLRVVDKKLDLLGYEDKLRYRVLMRPEYGYPLLQAARLAQRLNQSRISAIEFGVAGGNGLLDLEMHAERVTRETGVHVDIYGFDSGSGLPPPVDHRDAPYLFQAGFFKIDVEALKACLNSAKLVLGPVSETVQRFCAEEQPAPIGFIAFDLDYYSSTSDALQVFDSPRRYFLPRVACYFDDVVGDIDAAHNNFTGPLLAIDEFNAAHERVKIAALRGLRTANTGLPAAWHEKIFVAHLFEHPQYGERVHDMVEMPLDVSARSRVGRR